MEYVRRFLETRDGEPVDEFGVPIRVHYALIGLIAFLIGGITLAFALTPEGEPLRHPVVIAISCMGVLVPFVFAVFARRADHEFNERLIMAVLLLALVGPFICHFFIGSMRPAFLTLYMLGPIGAAYYAPLRRSWPVIAAGAAAILYVSSRIDEPDAMMRGIIVATITVASSLMVSAIHGHLSRTVESNREISERDPLTGAFNMHEFDERLDYEIELSCNGGHGFAIVEFDLDHFNEVNEGYGYAVGDEVLIATAEAIQSTLTPDDLLVRRGGDEFIVIAPVLARRNLHAMTLLARDRIASARRAICPDLTPTACAGWALHDHQEPAASIMERAGEVLHDSKRAAQFSKSESIVWRDLRETQDPERSNAPAPAEVAELRRRRAEEAAIGDDPMAGAMKIGWNTAGLSSVFLTLVLFAMGLFGQLSFDLSPAIYGLFIAWACILSPLAFWATRSEPSVLIDNLLAATALVLITATCLVIGPAAPAAVEMYMMGTLLYLILLPIQYALVYVFASYALYATFLFAHSYPYADVRVATTLVNFGVIGTIVALTRHTAIEAANEKAILARTDALTGLPNVRRLRSWLTEAIERSEVTGESIALLTLDLDEFKAVNDIHGHDTGDDVLVVVADVLHSAARDNDLPARRGGDEFVLAMKNANENDAQDAAIRLAEKVEMARADATPDLTPTTSIGWVVWRSGDTADDLLNRSDDALYDAKLHAREARASAVKFA